MDEGGVPLYKAAVLKENTSISLYMMNLIGLYKATFLKENTGPDLPIVGRFNYIRMLF